MTGLTRRDLLGVLLPITKALRRVEDEAAGEHGLTMWQYAVLAMVDARPDSNQGEVADALDYSRNRIVADLDLLEARGLIGRRPGDDRRSNLLRVTATGRRTMRSIRADIHHGEDELLVGLTLDDRRDLADIAARAADRLRSA